MPSFVRKVSSGSVSVFFLEIEKLLEALREEALRLAKENPEVEKIVLFGSLAEGRAIPGSDADVLIVLSQSSDSFLERIVKWQQKIRVDFPVDVFPYTTGELSTPLAQVALRKGIVLFERSRS